jgi:site-specific DNA recombinase
MLKNTAYIGQAAFGKKTSVVPKKRSKRSRGTFAKTTSSQSTPTSKWIMIPIPAIIDKKTFKAVQEKRIENSKFSSRNSKYKYLLSGLLHCKNCSYVFVGRTASHSKNKRQYYYCNGKADRSFIKKRCTAKPMPGHIIENIIWEQVKCLISNPELVLNEYWSRQKSDTTWEQSNMLLKQKQKEIRVLFKEKERIIDLYQSDLLTKKEVEERINRIRGKLSRVDGEIQLLQQENNEKNKQLHLVDQLDNFKDKFSNNLESLEFNEKREVIRLLVNSVEIDSTNLTIEINHTVPLKDLCRLSCTGRNK